MKTNPRGYDPTQAWSLVMAAALFGACHSAPYPQRRDQPMGSDRTVAAAADAHLGTAPTTTPNPLASAKASASPSAKASASREPLAPLSAPAPLVELEVTGFRPAVVSVPIGATEPRPIALALHGNFDRPEWQCEVMRDITGGFPFILCPRGIPRRDVSKSMDRWEYSSVRELEKEIEAGLAAMRSKYSAHVAEGPILFTGFSLGAILGRAIVAASPARYPRVIFTEGGAQGWNFKTFGAKGGQRVLLACAQRGCAPAARAVAAAAARQGVAVHVADAGNVGHTYDGPVARAIQAELPWLLEGDERWSGLRRD